MSLAPKTCHLHNQTHCGDCRLNALCLPLSLQIDDVCKLDDIVQRGRPLQKADGVYRAGEEFHAIFAVRSGAIKTLSHSAEGDEQVTGFYLPGEIIGLDGLANGQYTNTAIALETSAVCEIPFNRLEELSIQLPNLQRRFLQIMSRELASDQQLITLLSKKAAEERIAAFLVSISRRNQGRGLVGNEFYLPMSRSDIGNFLGLTIETVSRVFSRLHKTGIIQLDKKHIIILNMAALQDATAAEKF
ncbi:MAG TPA: fumarate/nitrate reduction transcriptional regulator Fnr [Cellvibrionaceae bacterium]